MDDSQRAKRPRSLLRLCNHCRGNDCRNDDIVVHIINSEISLLILALVLIQVVSHSTHVIFYLGGAFKMAVAMTRAPFPKKYHFVVVCLEMPGRLG